MQNRNISQHRDGEPFDQHDLLNSVNEWQESTFSGSSLSGHHGEWVNRTAAMVPPQSSPIETMNSNSEYDQPWNMAGSRIISPQPYAVTELGEPQTWPFSTSLPNQGNSNDYDWADELMAIRSPASTEISGFDRLDLDDARTPIPMPVIPGLEGETDVVIKTKSRKKAYEPERRKKVAAVREVGSCIGCKIRRVGCAAETPCGECTKRFRSSEIAKTFCLRLSLNASRFDADGDLLRLDEFKILSDQIRSAPIYHYVIISTPVCCGHHGSIQTMTMNAGFNTTYEPQPSPTQCYFTSRAVVPSSYGVPLANGPVLEVMFQDYPVGGHRELTGPWARLHRAINYFAAKCKGKACLNLKDNLLYMYLSFNRAMAIYHKACDTLAPNDDGSHNSQEFSNYTAFGAHDILNNFVGPGHHDIYSGSTNYTKYYSAQKAVDIKHRSGTKAEKLESEILRKLEKRVFSAKLKSKKATWSIENPLSTWLCILGMLLNYQEHMALIRHFHHDNDQVRVPLYEKAKILFNTVTTIYAAYFRGKNHPLSYEWDTPAIRDELGCDMEILQSFWNIKTELEKFYHEITQDREKLSQHEFLFSTLVVDQDRKKLRPHSSPRKQPSIQGLQPPASNANFHQGISYSQKQMDYQHFEDFFEPAEPPFCARMQASNPFNW